MQRQPVIQTQKLQKQPVPQRQKLANTEDNTQTKTQKTTGVLKL